MSKKEKFIKNTREGKYSDMAKDIILTIAIILGAVLTERLLDLSHRPDGHFNGSFFVGIILLLFIVKILYHIGVKIVTQLFFMFEKKK